MFARPLIFEIMLSDAEYHTTALLPGIIPVSVFEAMRVDVVDAMDHTRFVQPLETKGD